MKLVTQEHPMGCAVACVASLLSISYKQALKLFSHPEHTSTRGYYSKEICEALTRAKREYVGRKITTKNKELLNKDNSIVFVSRSLAYPEGHFLLKTKKGWMNPWSNCPHIKPAKSAFEKVLPGKPEWIIYSKRD